MWCGAQGVRRWAAVSFGENHAAGVSCEGVLYTWGLSNKGQLGRKDEGANEFPKPVEELESIEVRSDCQHCSPQLAGVGLLIVTIASIEEIS